MSRIADSPQSHYEHLAAIYAGRANVRANERYRLECLEWLRQCSQVLDLGCGTTDLLAALRAELGVLGIDLTLAILASGPGRGYVAAATAEQLPFENNTFDGALSINLLEHVLTRDECYLNWRVFCGLVDERYLPHRLPNGRRHSI